MRTMSQYLNKEEYYKAEIQDLQAQLSAKDALIDEAVKALEMCKSNCFPSHSIDQALAKIQEAKK